MNNKEWQWEGSPKNGFDRRRLERCYNLTIDEEDIDSSYHKKLPRKKPPVLDPVITYTGSFVKMCGISLICMFLMVGCIVNMIHLSYNNETPSGEIRE